MALLCCKYGVQIVYSKGRPYDEEIDRKEFRKWECKQNFKLVSMNLFENKFLTQIIFEYTEEYDDEMMKEKSGIAMKSLCVCCGHKEYELVLDQEFEDEAI